MIESVERICVSLERPVSIGGVTSVIQAASLKNINSMSNVLLSPNQFDLTFNVECSLNKANLRY